MNSVTDNATPPAAPAPDLSTTAGRIADLKQRYTRRSPRAARPPSPSSTRRARRPRASGSRRLLDHGSFVEFDEFVPPPQPRIRDGESRPYGDAVVIGTGTIHGRQVAVYAQDFTIFGGSLGEVAGEKIIKIMDHALKTGVPIVGMLDSGGARIQEGVVALGKYGEIFRRNTAASGVIPQISVIMEPPRRAARSTPPRSPTSS